MPLVSPGSPGEPQRGKDMSARGNAPGMGVVTIRRALEGRNNGQVEVMAMQRHGMAPGLADRDCVVAPPSI